MNEQVKNTLVEIVGADWVIDGPERVRSYCDDETEPAMKPEICYDCIAVKPRTAEEISKILTYANEEKLTVVARGGGTGMAGSAIPTQPSIIILLERMNKILEVDDINLTVECEAGVTLQDLVEYFGDHPSLFFPIHPGDEGAQVGGMVVQNAGGVRAVRYGVMRDQVKSIQVVVPTGEILTFGGKLIKDNAGYDLKDLIIGSEGTLGIVTKAVLDLHPKDPYSGSLLVSFDNPQDAVNAVPKIFMQGIRPLAIEYVEKKPVLASAEELGLTWPAKTGVCDLYFIVAARDEEGFYNMGEQIVGICEECGATDSIISEDSKEQRTILEIRSNIYGSLKPNLVDCLDLTVPVGMAPRFNAGVHEIMDEMGVEIQTIGHIGDGNFHNFIMTPDAKKPANYDQLIEKLFALAVECGGTITGEHGVGKVRGEHLRVQFPEKQLQLMRAIKQVFDPNGILNPGTALD